ncbi:aflatoxin-detoxifizyme [Mrakia frigida]|uniref:dipeptidyl-peptidase III n=1 Tax=Mrakia frigida TaxID=29902 RepID=UPI003FCC1589
MFSPRTITRPLLSTFKRTAASSRLQSIMASTNLADVSPPICGLEIATSFSNLTSKEKLYAHYQSKAGWAGGARIIMDQSSHDSQAIIDLLLSIVSIPNPKEGSQPPLILADLDAVFLKADFTDEDKTFFLEYTAQVFDNLSNFKSFGHNKFIPRLSQEKFQSLLSSPSPILSSVYSLDPASSLSIGKPSLGHTSGYFPLPSSSSPAFQDSDAELVQKALEKLKVDVLNTRVIGKEGSEWVVGVASVETGDVELATKDAGVKIRKGDFSKELERVSDALLEAKKYAANENQEGMIDDYIKSFRTGAINDHIKGSEKWVKDIGPVVESYIGFIETYVDPYGARAEWEGFTAIVNKELSAKYDILVGRAEDLIRDLPWGEDWEVDVFNKPDFTALEIVSFATGGIPAGINIPNYFSVRDKLGFKNVSLANILAASDPNEKMTFLHPDDVPLYKAWDKKAFELQVANHELLGHGSGKLFQEAEDGTLNFDIKTVINPLTRKPVTSWYKFGQTPGSVLGTCSSSYEECRAEAVALYLASNKEILTLFKHESKEDQEDIQVATFLLMARAGVRALEFYNPEGKKHGQAHMQARLGITNALIADGIAVLTEERDAQGKLENAYIRVDKEKVLTQGRACTGKLLVDLQVRKCMADGEGAREFYAKLTDPLPGWDTELRDLVIEKKAARKIFVQPNTFLTEDGKDVVLKEYPLTLLGKIESFVERDI